ncbi:hypothetical protein [Pendulispora albinea]|uniref:Lipoprotein n=1 Tax=Pendulispora albinea TaxID=2741071 RepID=A0ABZ2LXS7_9BACT
MWRRLAVWRRLAAWWRVAAWRRVAAWWQVAAWWRVAAWRRIAVWRAAGVRVAGFAFLVILAMNATLATGCSRSPPDATPDGVVRLWLERMETSTRDPRAAREAYALLGPATRKNLEVRAERASRIQGRRFEPYEMLAEGRFGLRFRAKTMSVVGPVGEEARVDVVGTDPAVERATVRCAREQGVWRIEPELPEVTEVPRWRDGG